MWKRKQHFGKRYISIFNKIHLAPDDPILSQTIAFNKDPNPIDYKINLGVGAYRDNNGNPVILNCVKRAENLIINNKDSNHEYLPILGSKKFIELVQKFLFKHQYSKKLLDNNRIITGQGLSGTGSLRIIGELIKLTNNIDKIYIPNPSWSNHESIFKKCGLKTGKYRYYDFKNHKLDLKGMLDDLNKLNSNDAVLIHVCCHNPTGVDPTNEQWDEILELINNRNLLPIFDMAYQGFNNGIDEDLNLIEKMSKLMVTKNKNIKNFMLAQSFAKNLGLYGERIGSFSIITANKEERIKVESQVKILVRSMYSSPPKYGSKIVEEILSNKELYNEWINEVSLMRNRLKDMRLLLYDELKNLNCYGPGLNNNNSDNDLTGWEHLIEQHGMFCFTGLTPEQVDALERKSIYLTRNGRISIAGINTHNVSRLSRCIADLYN